MAAAENGNHRDQTPHPGFTPGVPLVGQPFTFLTMLIPVTATLKCNCGGADTTVTIQLSTPGTCPACGKTFNVGLNPTTMKLEIAMGIPGPAKDPS